MWKVFWLTRISARVDSDMALLGASVLACMMGTLVMMGTVNFQWALAQMYWLLGGIAAAYVQIRPGPAIAKEEQSMVPSVAVRGRQYQR
jgi:hypothetical protein